MFLFDGFIACCVRHKGRGRVVSNKTCDNVNNSPLFETSESKSLLHGLDHGVIPLSRNNGIMRARCCALSLSHGSHG